MDKTILHAAATVPATQPAGLRIRALFASGAEGPQVMELRRPVTVIGSRRHADMVFHDDAVGRSHAAIVNTGTAVLLADLLSESGTTCNGCPVKLRVLRDGDVIQVGSQQIKLEIALHSAAWVEQQPGGVDPLAMPCALELVRQDTQRHMTIREAVAVIGGRRNADVHLEAEEMPLAHSLLFASHHGVAIHDLGSHLPLRVNGQPVHAVRLRPNDCIAVGPFEMLVHMTEDTGGSGNAFHHQMVAAVRAAVARTAEPAHAYHPGPEARTREIVLREFIGPLLPEGVAAGYGTLIDSSGQASPPLDVILYDAAAMPALMRGRESSVVPVECCIQVIEVRAQLTEASLLEVIEKAAAVRALRPLPAGRGAPLAPGPTISLVAFSSDLHEPDRSDWSRYMSLRPAEQHGHLLLNDLCVVGRGYWSAGGPQISGPKAAAACDEVVMLLERCLDAIHGHCGGPRLSPYISSRPGPRPPAAGR